MTTQFLLIKYLSIPLLFLLSLFCAIPVKAQSSLLDQIHHIPTFILKYSPPEISTATEKHQLGGWVTVTGNYFSPYGTVRIYADGLVGRIEPLSIGTAVADANGHFSTIIDARCWSYQFNSVTIRAVDEVSGLFGTDTTYAYSCG